jgi:3-methyladenine DNA glycosylase AlkC
MAEPFKTWIDAAVVQAIAQHVQRSWSGFDAAGFTQQALAGLDGLELKARVQQLAGALARRLPDDADRACGILEASLGPPARADGEAEDWGALRTSDAGLAGWAVWPLTEAVALRTVDTAPERGLLALQAMTQRLTAEFAIRPFFIQQPATTLRTVSGWLGHPSAHVRRLVSEGSRPRLPWGLRLQALVADPSPTLPWLQVLQDDRSAYVRRSVANHLNDIAKDHPALVADWLSTHLPGASAERSALLKHASRGLVKAGDAAVLAAWGLGAGYRGRLGLAVSPPALALGEVLTLTLDLQSTAPHAQRLAIDYAVHHVKAAGHTTPKVFKGWVIELAPGERRQLVKRHAMKLITTRRYHPGAHAVDVRINGQVLAEAAFGLTV